MKCDDMHRTIRACSECSIVASWKALLYLHFRLPVTNAMCRRYAARRGCARVCGLSRSGKEAHQNERASWCRSQTCRIVPYCTDRLRHDVERGEAGRAHASIDRMRWPVPEGICVERRPRYGGTASELSDEDERRRTRVEDGWGAGRSAVIQVDAVANSILNTRAHHFSPLG